jgi:hypothetical protein
VGYTGIDVLRSHRSNLGTKKLFKKFSNLNLFNENPKDNSEFETELNHLTLENDTKIRDNSGVLPENLLPIHL